MTTNTIPEQIVPSQLTILDGQDFTSVTAAALPNGDDALTVTTAADSNLLRAYQNARIDSYLLPAYNSGGIGNPEIKNALSFWIRRRQNFDPQGTVDPVISAFNAGAAGTPGSVLMGVGDPIAPSLAPGGAPAGWLLCAADADTICLGQLGLASTFGRRWYFGPGVDLPLDEWVFVVFDMFTHWEAGGSGSRRGGQEVYRNGVTVGLMTPTSSTNYYTSPQFFGGYGTYGRFAIGDPTGGGNAVEGVGAGPLYDIGKLCFHNRQLTTAEMLTLIESMRYGPAAP